MIQIEYVDSGVANRFKDCIELNKHLVDYPILHQALIDHELRHTKLFNKPTTIQDIKNDINSTAFINQFELMKFMVKHPKSLTQLLPFYWHGKRGFVYDFNMIVFYLLLIFVIGIPLVILL